MAENEVQTPLFTNDAILSGRRILLTSRKKAEINENTIPDILRGVALRHDYNVRQIDILLEEYLGDQEILVREREFAEQTINNTIVVNRSKEIVRKSVGYFLGEPITYTSQAKTNDSGAFIEDLNVYMDEEDKAAKDIELGEWASICGTAFRLTMATPKDSASDIPFKIPTGDPRDTGVIYSSEVLQQPMLGFICSKILDDNYLVIGYKYYIYDDAWQYEFRGTGNAALLGEINFVEKKEHLLGEVPIVEYMNNQWRVGDYEPAMGLLDALNISLSDRVNAVVQTVGSILLFIDCEPDDEGTAKIKQRGCLRIKTNQNQFVDVRYVAPELLQADAQILESTINDYIDAVTGIPSRSQKSGGGGDTGDAVYLRDGYQDLELVARGKERAFKRAERKTLRLVSRIMGLFGKAFDPRDVAINFVRNRSTNILSKSQAALMFVKSGLLDPVDIIKIIGITDQPAEMAARGQTYKEAKTEVDLENAEAMAEIDSKNVAGNVLVADNTKTQTTDKAKTSGGSPDTKSGGK